MGKPKSFDKKSIISVEEANGNEPCTDWRSIYVAAALSFVGSAQFSLYFSALWPYLQTLDKSATEQFFGYIVAVYSLGQIISSPLFGFWSNKIKQVGVLLYVGLFLMFLGNAFYIAFELVSFPKWLMFFGRFINGAGSGNVILLRTYASTASTFKDRPRAIAFATGGQALGMTCGPIFQLIFTPLGYPGFKIFNNFLTINLYTAPAYLACIMNIFGGIALKFLFKENYAGIIKTTEKSSATQDSKSSVAAPKLPMYDIIAVFICYFTRFTQMFINTNLETIGSAFSMMMFDFSETKSVTYTAAAQGLIGAFTFITYFAYIAFNLENYISARKSCMLSLIILILFHLITYSWPFIPGNVTMFSGSSTTNNQTTLGCNIDKFTWCQSLKPVNVYLYYVAYIIALGFAFPIMNITTTTLFSKILGPRLQGTQQGIFQSAGSAARMIGPISISILYTSYGPRMAWNMEIIVIGATFISWCVFYPRMVALKIPPSANNNNENAISSPITSIEEAISKSYSKMSSKTLLTMSKSMP